MPHDPNKQCVLDEKVEFVNGDLVHQFPSFPLIQEAMLLFQRQKNHARATVPYADS